MTKTLEHLICVLDRCQVVLRPDGTYTHYHPGTHRVIATTTPEGGYVLGRPEVA